MAKISGKCICGSVEVTVKPAQEQFSACHCEMCRKWSAGPFLAMGCGKNVVFNGVENITTFQSSEWAERLFCNKCGTSIAWQLKGGEDCHVSSQLFKETADFPFELQVFIDEKPGNYNFKEPTKTMTGPEIFALFSPSESQ